MGKSFMNPLTLEWIQKAEGDFATAGRELRARKNPNYDAACFHAQQCAEKYLKAILQELSVPFGKSHNLIGLLDLLLSQDSAWEDIRADLEVLSVYAVGVRYPGGVRRQAGRTNGAETFERRAESSSAQTVFARLISAHYRSAHGVLSE